MDLSDGIATLAALGFALPAVAFSFLQQRKINLLTLERERDRGHAVGLEQALTAEVLNRERLDHLPIALWHRAQDGTIGWANSEAHTLFGEDLKDLTTPAMVRMGKRSLERKSVQSTSQSAIREGKRRILDIIETPLPDGSGSLGIAFDITAFAEIQTTLDRQIDAHDKVLESLTVGIAIFDQEKSLRFYNPALIETIRIDEASLQDRPRIGILLERLRDARVMPEVVDWQAYKRQWESHFMGVLEPLVSLEHLPDGRTLKQTLTAHPQGGILMMLEDVTDRLALEASFNTLVDVQRAILDNLDEGAALWGQDHRLKFYNPVWARLWQFDDEDLKGEPHFNDLVKSRRDLVSFNHDEWQRQLNSAIRIIADRTARRTRIHRPDGMSISSNWLPLPDGNTLLTQLDVTDTVRIESALTQRAEALEAADRLKSAFIANISYDLRTPLTATLGFAQILEQQFFGTLNPRQLEYATAIRQSSEKLSNLINTMLDLASLEAGYLELSMTETTSGEILSGAIELIAERARSQNVPISILPGSADIPVFCDAKRIKQAVFNVFDDAINLIEPSMPISVLAMTCTLLTDGSRQTEQNLDAQDAQTEGALQDGLALKIVYPPAASAWDRVPEEISTSQNTSVVEPAKRNPKAGEPSMRDRQGAKMSFALVQKLMEVHGGAISFTADDTGSATVLLTLPLKPPTATG